MVNLRYGGTYVGTKCPGAGRGYVRAVRGYGRYVLSFAYPFSKWPQGEVAVETAVQRYSSTAVQQYMCRGQRTARRCHGGIEGAKNGGMDRSVGESEGGMMERGMMARGMMERGMMERGDDGAREGGCWRDAPLARVLGGDRELEGVAVGDAASVWARGRWAAWAAWRVVWWLMAGDGRWSVQ